MPRGTFAEVNNLLISAQESHLQSNRDGKPESSATRAEARFLTFCCFKSSSLCDNWVIVEFVTVTMQDSLLHQRSDSVQRARAMF
jgi:hypothetical protein